MQWSKFLLRPLLVCANTGSFDSAQDDRVAFSEGTKINIKGVGQECPTHTVYVISE